MGHEPSDLTNIAAAVQAGPARQDVHRDGTRSKAFKYLWPHLHERNAWDENPYVVAIASEIHKQNIDALATSLAA